MKKKYQQPLIKVLSVENEPLLNDGSIVKYHGEQKGTLWDFACKTTKILLLYIPWA